MFCGMGAGKVCGGTGGTGGEFGCVYRCHGATVAFDGISGNGRGRGKKFWKVMSIC